MFRYSFFFIFFLVSCFKQSLKTPGALTVPIKSEISTLDPHQSYDLVSNLIVYQMYEPLYQYHYLKRPYTLEPLIADELPKVSDDGMTYEIKIKNNLQYHHQEEFENGPRFVTSEDFVTSFKRLAFQGTESRGWWLLKGRIKGLDAFRKKAGKSLKLFQKLDVEGLKTPDQKTLIISLTKPFPQLIHILAMTFTAPIPLEIVVKNKNIISTKDFGTGPYWISEFSEEEFAKMNRNKNYQTSLYPTSGDRVANKEELLKNAGVKIPFADQLIFKIIPDDEKRWKAFINKEVDFIDIPPTKLHSVLNLNGKLKEKYKKDDMSLDVSSSLVFWWLAFNMKDPIIGKNKNLRKAIAHAINIEKYISNFYYNTGRRANSIFPPGVLGYNPSQDFHYHYSLREAKKYLAIAGYPEGQGLPVIEFHTRRNGEQHIRMAQFIKKELSKVGIVVRIVVNKFTDFLKKSRESKMQFWQGGWLMDYPDPENVLQLLYSKNGNGGPNKTSFNNKRYDELYRKLLASKDESEKLKILKEMESIVIDEVPWIMTNYSINYLIRHNHLKNLRYSDLIFNLYKYLKK